MYTTTIPLHSNDVKQDGHNKDFDDAITCLSISRLFNDLLKKKSQIMAYCKWDKEIS